MPAAELSHIPEGLRHLAVPIEALNPDPQNARQHDESNIGAIFESYKAFGQRTPVVVQKTGMVIRAGNGRLEAAKRLGWTCLAALVIDEGDDTAQAFALADNRTGELASWNNPVLADLLAATPEHLLPATGFDGKYLTDLLDELHQPVISEDEAPAPLREAASRLGDLWVLGDHRLLCGDSTKAENVARVLCGAKWACMVTDPPYGVAYEGGRNPDSNTPRTKIAGDDDAALYARFLPEWMNHRAQRGVVYLWFAGVFGGDVYAAVEGAGLKARALLIWNKLDAHYGNFMAQYMQKHEPCLYCVVDGTDWNGPTNEVTVWDIKQPSRNENHPTEKPVECMGRAVRNSTAPGAVVVDAFSGSGTTIIACEQLGRKCYAIEIAPIYIDVAIRRWQKLTGKEATLDGTGQTWEHVAKERGVPIHE